MVFELLVVYSVYLVFSVAQFTLSKLARFTLTAVRRASPASVAVSRACWVVAAR